ncbi:MAG TPA: hypothetical protein VLK82_10210 [Candidatus Tectomicrobia bacterium]|nr:hypothetical protein [Candidatus Tectomicrobia bacterium]
MRRLRIEVSVLVVISVFWTGTLALAGPGRKVGPPLTPPGQAVETPGKAEGRHVGPVDTAPGKAKEQPKKGKQQGHIKQHPLLEGVPTEWPSARGRRHGLP